MRRRLSSMTRHSHALVFLDVPIIITILLAVVDATTSPGGGPHATEGSCTKRSRCRTRTRGHSLSTLITNRASPLAYTAWTLKRARSDAERRPYLSGSIRCWRKRRVFLRGVCLFVALLLSYSAHAQKKTSCGCDVLLLNQRHSRIAMRVTRPSNEPLSHGRLKRRESTE